MARASVAATNAAIQAVLPTPGTQFLTLHSADPGTTGASEFTTVTRVAYAASTAASGSVSNTAAISVSNGGTQAALFIGIWSAVTVGTYTIGAALGSSVTAATITFAVGAAQFTAS